MCDPSLCERGQELSPRHFWTHFGSLLEDRFGTHFCSLLEAVSGLILELIWSAESVPESNKKAYGILEHPYPNLESFRCTLLRYKYILRKLDGSLRTQLELPR